MAETNERFGPDPESLQRMREMSEAMTVPGKELSAVVFPELGKRNSTGENGPVSETEALDKLNTFLSELNAQGADIVTILDVDVKADSGAVEGRKFAVIRRPNIPNTNSS